MKRDWLGIFLVALLALGVAYLVFPSCAHAQRTYWVRSVDSLATGKVPHTHVETTGLVTLIAKEDDGDIHIRLTSRAGKFIICECVPAMPCPILPRLGDSVRVRGIYRHDPEHDWLELHPVEMLTVIWRAVTP